MVTFMFHIRVKPGCEGQALQTLSAIERESRTHDGCINFSWLQRTDSPYEFVLFEQWKEETALEAHKERSPGNWNSFVPCLDGEPYSRQFRSVPAMQTPLGDDEVRSFAQAWFDKLSAHVDVGELVPMISPGPDLEIVFPEQTIRRQSEFRQWYEGIGREFSDQAHDVESLDAHTLDDGDTGVDVTVVWKADRRDGSSVSARARQSWKLRRSFGTGAPEIVSYRVLSLSETGSAR
jgi:quinol monooxygenase YgiN